MPGEVAEEGWAAVGVVADGEGGGEVAEGGVFSVPPVLGEVGEAALAEGVDAGLAEVPLCDVGEDGVEEGSAGEEVDAEGVVVSTPITSNPSLVVHENPCEERSFCKA